MRRRPAATSGGPLGIRDWLPDGVLDDLVTTQAAIATDLEVFDQRITERGWIFDEDESDEDFAFWFYEPSAAAPSTRVRSRRVTTIWMSADEDAEIAHLMLAGADDDVPFEPDALFEHLDVIEAFRFGDAPPDFN